MSPSSPFRLGYRPALDGLRAVGVLMVMALHARAPFSGPGYLGVDIFFVLSGFLITGVLVEEYEATGRISFVNFYLRRAIRLFPALWFMLAAMIVMIPLAQVGVVLVYTWNWSMIYGWFSSPSPVLDPLWSLSVEEQYYLVWPLVLSLLLRYARPRARFIASLAAAGLCAAWAAGLALAGATDARLHLGSDTHASELLFGSALALGQASGLLPLRLLRPAAYILPPAAAVVAGLFYASVGRFLALGGMVLIALAVGSLIVSPPPLIRRLLELWPLVVIGRISYGLYLWSIPAQFVLFLLAPTWLANTVPARLAAGFVAAAISWRYIERPASRLKSRLTAPATAGNITTLRPDSSS